MDRTELAAVVQSDLESILARTRTAYLERIPRLAELPGSVLEDTIVATRRTIRAFLRYYIEGTLDAESWRVVRDATLERAGEVFTRDEILEFFTVSRSVASDAVQRLGELHPDLPEEEIVRIGEAIDRYLTELALQEDQLRHPAPTDRLDDVLRQLEDEGADLA